MNEEATGSAIHVEVAYATIERQCVIPLKVTNGTTAYVAIRLSKIEQEFEVKLSCGFDNEVQSS